MVFLILSQNNLMIQADRFQIGFSFCLKQKRKRTKFTRKQDKGISSHSGIKKAPYCYGVNLLALRFGVSLQRPADYLSLADLELFGQSLQQIIVSVAYPD